MGSGCARRSEIAGLALLLALLPGPVARAAPAAPAPPDTLSSGSDADSTRAVSPAAPDSIRMTRRVGPESAKAGPVGADSAKVGPMSVDLNQQRKRGDVTLSQAFRTRRASLLLPIPLFGPPVGAFLVPDAGSRIRLSDLDLIDPDGATQRTLLSGSDFGIGIPDLAMTVDSPELQGVETLEWNALPDVWDPGPFTRPGMLVSEPAGDPGVLRVMPGERGRTRRARSALYYGNGDAGEKQAGAQFASPSLGKGVAASYMRHESDGLAPLGHSRSARYALALGLPSALGHEIWIQGRIFDWDLEDRSLVLDALGNLMEVRGRSEIDTRDLALHARASGDRWESRWLFQTAGVKRTSVGADVSREEWDLPANRVEWDGLIEPSSGWTALASARLGSRRVDYRDPAGSGPSEHREDARARVGLRRSLGSGGGFQADVAGDWLETEPSLVDGRASLWGASDRAAGRVDLEWAHERPSWVDRLSPSRVWIGTRYFDGRTLRLERAGDPSLQPRGLRGGVARGSVEISRILALEVEGSLRHVTHDFGWTVHRVEDVDTLFVETHASELGNGLVSYGGLALRLRAGPIVLRGAGWARGGPESLSPIAGGPPRVGGDASLDARVVLFSGDLPLEAGLSLHAQGPREGILRAPGTASLDAALRADLGAAGAFLEFLNVFDRRDLPSSILDLSTGAAAPMPGRAFHIGIVWYLFD